MSAEDAFEYKADIKFNPHQELNNAPDDTDAGKILEAGKILLKSKYLPSIRRKMMHYRQF